MNEVYSERVITRLGDGISDNRRLSSRSIQKSIDTLRRFSQLTSQYNVHKTSAAATSALREAVNSNDFLVPVMEETGINIKVISGKQEAEITAAGMLMDFNLKTPALLLDIGGGSTELMLLEPASFERKGTSPSLVHSFNLGVVYLAGKYMKEDPPSRKMLSSMRDEISAMVELSGKAFVSQMSDETVLVGTAGTVTALSAISQRLTVFDHSRIHKHILTLDNIDNIYSEISVLSPQERSRLIPFDLARLDILVPGTLILLTLMKHFSFREIMVSNHGLLEGLLIDLHDRIS